ncbi:MAG: FAD-dependent oxidoreductase, partial [Trueperaceae bacterium]|nr:FAD-dependent oxidoreductase [Trueperaceae bacterium]
RPLGLDARMADTLVFRVDGVDWSALQRAAAARGRGYAVVGERAAHGAFDGHPAAYRPLDPRLGLRGLNLGRQDDGSVLVNALLVYGVDPFDPASLADGRARAAAEVPHVVAWLRALPGFADARAGGVADALYVRQTRQVATRCTLTVDDVLDHVVTDLDVAAGGYPLDVQSLRPGDAGAVFATPDIYGARLCMTVPEGLDGLWVVGRSFGTDPLAMSSARVVPFGMSLAEAVGVAAALAERTARTPAEVAADPVAVRRVRARLLARGAYLPPVAGRAPSGPHGHPRYADYRAMVRWGLALGGYDNAPGLDDEVPFSALSYALLNVAMRAYGDEEGARVAIARVGIDGAAVAPERAVRAFAAFAAEVAPGALPEAVSWATLRDLGLGFDDPGRPLRRGEVYAFGRLLLDLRGPVSDPLAAAGPR